MVPNLDFRTSPEYLPPNLVAPEAPLPLPLTLLNLGFTWSSVSLSCELCVFSLAVRTVASFRVSCRFAANSNIEGDLLRRFVLFVRAVPPRPVVPELKP